MLALLQAEVLAKSDQIAGYWWPIRKNRTLSQTQVEHLRPDSLPQMVPCKLGPVPCKLHLSSARPGAQYLRHLPRWHPEQQARIARRATGVKPKRQRSRVQWVRDPWRRTLHGALGCVWARGGQGRVWERAAVTQYSINLGSARSRLPAAAPKVFAH